MPNLIHGVTVVMRASDSFTTMPLYTSNYLLTYLLYAVIIYLEFNGRT